MLPKHSGLFLVQFTGEKSRGEAAFFMWLSATVAFKVSVRVQFLISLKHHPPVCLYLPLLIMKGLGLVFPLSFRADRGTERRLKHLPDTNPPVQLHLSPTPIHYFPPLKGFNNSEENPRLRCVPLKQNQDQTHQKFLSTQLRLLTPKTKR